MSKWKEIPGFSRYEVSNNGCVRRHKNKPIEPRHSLLPGQLLKPSRDKNGYIRYCLTDDYGKRWSYPVSRYIALTFIGPPPSNKHWALHKDDDKSKNFVSNIYWGTAQHNSNDRLRNGHAGRSLSDKDIIFIKRVTPYLKDKGCLSSIFGVDRSTIYRYLKR